MNKVIVQKPCHWIESQSDIMLEQTMQLSAINSGTHNLAGLTRVAEEFSSLFAPLADTVEVLDSHDIERVDHQGSATTERYGKILSFSKRKSAPFQVLLCGHMDTVFPRDHTFQVPQQIDQHTVTGPGVADMKGGLLVMLTALEAFERSQTSDQLGWQVILNSDEETGSLGSSHVLKAAAQQAHAGLIYEPALADGTLAGARKGSGNFTLVAHGQSAHAGREFSSGRNAIMALTDAMLQLASLTNIQRGITVNIARISGGQAFNVVPDQAVCQFNIRCQLPEDQQVIAATLQQIVKDCECSEGIRMELSGGFTRPPKAISAANQLLMDWTIDCAHTMDIDLRFKDTGGCCDGNNLAAAGLANIDTLGVLGGNIHTEKEFMLIDSLTQRAQLSFLLLNRLASAGEQLRAGEQVVK